jgi:hypothetical protein
MAVSVRVLHSCNAATVKSRQVARGVARQSNTFRTRERKNAPSGELGETSVLPTNAVTFEGEVDQPKQLRPNEQDGQALSHRAAPARASTLLAGLHRQHPGGAEARLCSSRLGTFATQDRGEAASAESGQSSASARGVTRVRFARTSRPYASRRRRGDRLALLRPFELSCITAPEA